MRKQRQPARPMPATPQNRVPFVIIAFVLLAAAAGGAWLLYAARGAASPVGTLANGTPGAQPAHASGPEGAPLTLEEFGDYQCPSCGSFYSEVEKLRTEHGDKLHFIFRQYPLTQAHQHALTAAHAAEAAGLQNRFWEMHEQLFRNQRDWAKAAAPQSVFENYARAAGLDVARFTRDMNSAEVDARIVADHERAKSVGITSTPTFFLNGRELPASKLQTPADLRTALAAALAGRSF